ncbi:MAG: rod-binding protein [Rhodothermales bacterium]
MNVHIDGSILPQNVQAASPDAERPRNPQEAARQFEHILVKQMVQAMTKDLFDGSIAGDDAPEWMGAYSDMQSDVLTEELANKITEDGRLGIAELLMKQWARRSDTDAPAFGAPSDKTEDPS